MRRSSKHTVFHLCSLVFLVVIDHAGNSQIDNKLSFFVSIHDFIPLYLSHGMMHHQTVALAHGKHNEEQRNWHQFYAGIQRILTTDYVKKTRLENPIWQQGATTLHHYPARGAPVLLTPSLINRADIFDIHPTRSIARFLAEQGFDTYIINWNEPSTAEHGFAVGDYVTQRLIPAIAHIHQQTGKAVSLTGYCMGGMMAMAAAQLAPKHIHALALLATPWDFSTRVHHLHPQNNGYHEWLSLLCDNTPIISGHLIHQILYYASPWVVYEKYRKLSTLTAGSEHEASVIEREHWLHNTVNMPSPAVKDCMLDWPLHNTPHLGAWQVDGNATSPTQITTPTLLISAEHDAIIPLESSTPLLEKISNITHIIAPSGHISMVAGHHARHHMWIPLAKWLRNR